MKSLFKITILSSFLFLAGCATFTKDGGFSSVEKATHSKIDKELKWIKTSQDQQLVDERIKELLSKPLSADDAVQISLFNNKKLQAAYYALGISEAELVQAGTLPNPGFSMLRASRRGDYKIEQVATFNILSLITMPREVAIEKDHFAKAQQEVSLTVMRLASDTKKAYLNAVAADASLQYMQQVKTAADASAELAQKMVEAGNFNKLDLARERFFYAEAAVGLAKAEQVKTIAYERLTRLMGLKATERHFQLPDHLPALPNSIVEQSNIEQTAMEQRLDLQAMQGETASLAKRLGLTKTTRFIDVLEIGPARVLEGKRSDPYKNGILVSLEIPIFDWGTARVARAEAIYMQSVNQLAAMAINAQSEVREKYAIYQSSYEIAKRYRDEIIPLSKSISDENQLRYNGMFVSVFDLLSDANNQIRNVNAHIDALRVFWIAQAEMEMTLIGGELPTERLN